MVIDRQTLVQIVLLFDIDHNDEDVHTHMCLKRKMLTYLYDRFSFSISLYIQSTRSMMCKHTS